MSLCIKVAPPRIYALIVAAGRSTRFGSAIPKQYIKANDQAMIRASVCSFLGRSDIAGVQVVIHPDDETLYQQALGDLDILPPAHGGQTRQDSVRHGLEAVDQYSPDIVLIHDAARPFVSQGVIDSVLQALQHSLAAIPGIEVTDTLKKVDTNIIIHSVDRNGLWRAQTPQGFHFRTILDAHIQCQGLSLTDDASILEHVGKGPVRMVAGDAENYKVTGPNDISDITRTTSRVMETRTGIGFDVHAFCQGSNITLCGIEIPFTRGLSGHSDADVAMHALTDALYGCIGAGDIGKHFPPSDPRWRGAPSSTFLRHARDTIRQQSGRIVHTDLTIICEEPKLGPYRQRMAESIASILEISASRVSIKATTTERLGFTGRQEGIAAQAIASVALPEK